MHDGLINAMTALAAMAKARAVNADDTAAALARFNKAATDATMATSTSSAQAIFEQAQHDAVLSKVRQIAAGELDSETGKWCTASQRGNVVRYRPIVLGDEASMPSVDHLSLDFFRQERRDPSRRATLTKGVVASFTLAENYSRGIRTVPTSHARTPAAVRAQARLALANTQSKLDDLLRSTLADVMDVGAVGTDANYTSFWLRWRHVCLESGHDPLRWALHHNPSYDTIRAEGELFGRAVLWAANYYGDYAQLNQFMTAVRIMHLRVAGVTFPLFEHVLSWKPRLKKYMNMASGPIQQRDSLESFEMNEIQDAAQEFASMHSGSANRKKARAAVRETAMDFVASVLRETGVRPAAVAPGQAEFDSRYGGAEGIQEHWTKRILLWIANLKVDTMGFAVPPKGKTDYTRTGKIQELRGRKKAFLCLPGPDGVRSAVSAARRLLIADPVGEHECPDDIPIVRDPPKYGGTGKSYTSADFNAWTKQWYAVIRKPADLRVIKGYSWRRGQSNAFKKAAAGIDTDRMRQLYLGHASDEMMMAYDDVEAAEVARIAHEAYNTPFDGVTAKGRTTVEGLQAQPINPAAPPSIGASQAQILSDGWDDASQTEIGEALAGSEEFDGGLEARIQAYSRALKHPVVYKSPHERDAEEHAKAAAELASNTADAARAAQAALNTAAAGVLCPGLHGKLVPCTTGHPRTKRLVPKMITDKHHYLTAAAELQWVRCDFVDELDQRPITKQVLLHRLIPADQATAGDDVNFPDLHGEAWPAVLLCPNTTTNTWQRCVVVSTRMAGTGKLRICWLACEMTDGSVIEHRADQLRAIGNNKSRIQPGAPCGHRDFFKITPPPPNVPSAPCASDDEASSGEDDDDCLLMHDVAPPEPNPLATSRPGPTAVAMTVQEAPAHADTRSTSAAAAAEVTEDDLTSADVSPDTGSSDDEPDGAGEPVSPVYSVTHCSSEEDDAPDRPNGAGPPKFKPTVLDLTIPAENWHPSDKGDTTWRAQADRALYLSKNVTVFEDTRVAAVWTMLANAAAQHRPPRDHDERGEHDLQQQRTAYEYEAFTALSQATTYVLSGNPTSPTSVPLKARAALQLVATMKEVPHGLFTVHDPSQRIMGRIDSWAKAMKWLMSLPAGIPEADAVQKGWALPMTTIVGQGLTATTISVVEEPSVPSAPAATQAASAPVPVAVPTPPTRAAAARTPTAPPPTPAAPVTRAAATTDWFKTWMTAPPPGAHVYMAESGHWRACVLTDDAAQPRTDPSHVSVTFMRCGQTKSIPAASPRLMRYSTEMQGWIDKLAVADADDPATANPSQGGTTAAGTGTIAVDTASAGNSDSSPDAAACAGTLLDLNTVSGGVIMTSEPLASIGGNPSTMMSPNDTMGTASEGSGPKPPTMASITTKSSLNWPKPSSNRPKRTQEERAKVAATRSKLKIRKRTVPPTTVAVGASSIQAALAAAPQRVATTQPVQQEQKVPSIELHGFKSKAEMQAFKTHQKGKITELAGKMAGLDVTAEITARVLTNGNDGRVVKDLAASTTLSTAEAEEQAARQAQVASEQASICAKLQADHNIIQGSPEYSAWCELKAVLVALSLAHYSVSMLQHGFIAIDQIQDANPADIVAVLRNQGGEAAYLDGLVIWALSTDSNVLDWAVDQPGLSVPGLWPHADSNAAPELTQMHTTVAEAWQRLKKDGISDNEVAHALGITDKSAITVTRCYQVLLWTRLGIRLQAESESMVSYNGTAGTQQSTQAWEQQCQANQEALVDRAETQHRFTEMMQLALQALAGKIEEDRDSTAEYSFATTALMQAALCPLYAALERWTDELVEVHSDIQIADVPALQSHAASRSMVEYAEWVGFLCVAMGTAESTVKWRHLSTASDLIHGVSSFGTTNVISASLQSKLQQQAVRIAERAEDAQARLKQQSKDAEPAPALADDAAVDVDERASDAGSDGAQEQFVVERILSARGHGAKRTYLVRWSGYTSEDDSWEPQSSLVEATDVMNDFMASAAAASADEDEEDQESDSQIVPDDETDVSERTEGASVTRSQERRLAQRDDLSVVLQGGTNILPPRTKRLRRQTERQVQQSLDDLEVSSDNDEEDDGQSFPAPKGGYQPSVLAFVGFKAGPEEGTRGVKRPAADMNEAGS